MKKYMLLDKDNIIINVLSFEDNHNENLQKFVQITPGAEKILEIENEEFLFGVGLIYDESSNKAIPSQPYSSWIWDEIEWNWICPVPVPENPENKRYVWDEENMQWILANSQEG